MWYDCYGSGLDQGDSHQNPCLAMKSHWMTLGQPFSKPKLIHTIG